MSNTLTLTSSTSYTPPLPAQDVVLVVDDDPDMRIILETILVEPNRRVVAVDSGESALDWMIQNRVSLVLLDVQLPGLNGYETAQHIRAQERFSDLPILFLTATYRTEALVAQGFSVGAFDYLSKPLDTQLLRNKVSIFLCLQRQRLALELELERRRQAEEALRLSAIVFEHSPEGVMITDKKGTIISVNRAFEKVTGYTEAEAIGQKPSLLHSGRHDQAFYHQLWQTLENTGQWHGEIWNRRKDGEIYPEWLNIVAVRNEQGIASNYVGIFSDFSGRDQLRERLHQSAYFDPLTGLPNRQMLFDRLQLMLAQAQRDSEQLALAFIDLDNFKRINDTLGHPAGDALLQAVALRLRSQVREIDTFARLDGDVFALLLPALNDGEDVARMTQHLLSELKRPLSVKGRSFHLQASAGISVYPNDGETATDLFKHADTALHLAKETGANGIQFYTQAMSVRFQERLELEDDLHQAIETEGLNLAYQPQVSLTDGRLIGVEALARWHHPQHGSIPPDRFIAVAEDAGLIGALGEWVLENACQQGVDWLANHDRPLRVAVNVSAHQLHDGGFHHTVARVLKETGLPASCLELEITESMLMETVDETILTLERLHALGVQLSIDDFGTGYSSLSYLKRFAIHKIKIDRSFVCDVPEDSNDMAIINAVIAMAHSLNLQVVAEGVETEAQLDFLQQALCDEIQGYLFSPPVRADEIAPLLEQEFVVPKRIIKG
ncbi:MAG TPA: EAL domain-containing protein [Gammaproteobacteria bacterium]|nr:EAL domain-containing protein [Gammaproteobacteria bacterium]